MDRVLIILLVLAAAFEFSDCCNASNDILLQELGGFFLNLSQALKDRDFNRVETFFTENFVDMVEGQPTISGTKDLLAFFASIPNPENVVNGTLDTATGPLCDANGETYATSVGVNAVAIAPGTDPVAFRIFYQYKLVNGKWRIDVSMANRDIP